jgi:hypothetical protein
MAEIAGAVTARGDARAGPGTAARATRLILVAIAVLTVWSAWLGAAPVPPPGPRVPPSATDDALYRSIARRVARGEDYHDAAATEQRARGFPLRPVVTMRAPLLAELTAAVGGEPAIGWVQRALWIVLFALIALRLGEVVDHPATRFAATVALMLQLALMSGGIFAVLHDIWAGVLVTAAIVLRRPERYAIAIACAVAAAALRELAWPVFGAMILAALYERRWGEARAWAVAGGAVLAYLGWHWWHVAQVTLPTDGRSAGWLRAQGWRWVVDIYANTGALSLLPRTLGFALVPLALFGWLAVEPALRRRVAIWLAGMTSVFLVLGRPDNFYWGALIGPLLPMGAALAPLALVRLVKGARAG